MTTGMNHRDCRNYAPIDVVKGLCHVRKTLVVGDLEACDAFSLMPRCRHCTRFLASADTVELGVCQASTHEPKFFAYPDMVAATCGDFRLRS